MTTLSKATVSQIRADLNAAMAAVSKKHGVDFTIGTLRFSESVMSGKLSGVARPSVGAVVGSPPVRPEGAALVRVGKALLGANFDSTKNFRSSTLGTVKFVGFNSNAKKYPFIVTQVSTGKTFKITSQSAKTVADTLA